MIILITGITSGFGRAMASALSSEGHTVYGTYRHPSDPLPSVTYIQADSTVEEECAYAVKRVVQEQGRIDVFINNAGMGIGGPVEFTQTSDARRQMEVNFMGMVNFLHYVVPVMRLRSEGRIICFSSIGGLMGLPFQGFYSASKFAIEGLCEALRLELRGTGVKVVVVEPGDFATSFTASRKSVSSPEALEAYPSYGDSLASIEQDETGGLKPEYLAKRIASIVKKKNPKYSYVISTFEQRLSILLKAILPAPVFAKILAGYYKL